MIFLFVCFAFVSNKSLLKWFLDAFLALSG